MKQEYIDLFRRYGNLQNKHIDLQKNYISLLQKQIEIQTHAFNAAREQILTGQLSHPDNFMIKYPTLEDYLKSLV